MHKYMQVLEFIHALPFMSSLLEITSVIYTNMKTFIFLSCILFFYKRDRQSPTNRLLLRSKTALTAHFILFVQINKGNRNGSISKDNAPNFSKNGL